MRDVATNREPALDTPAGLDPMLVCKAGALLVALPLRHVVETMRPQPIVSVAGVPAFVQGLAVVRGQPVPVVDARLMFSTAPAGPPGRLVTLRSGARSVALAVDAVLGVWSLPADRRQALPPLVQNTSTQVVATIGALDRELLIVLEASRVVPESVWAAIQSEGAR